MSVIHVHPLSRNILLATRIKRKARIVTKSWRILENWVNFAERLKVGKITWNDLNFSFRRIV